MTFSTGGPSTSMRCRTGDHSNCFQRAIGTVRVYQCARECAPARSRSSTPDDFLAHHSRSTLPAGSLITKTIHCRPADRAPALVKGRLTGIVSRRRRHPGQWSCIHHKQNPLFHALSIHHRDFKALRLQFFRWVISLLPAASTMLLMPPSLLSGKPSASFTRRAWEHDIQVMVGRSGPRADGPDRVQRPKSRMEGVAAKLPSMCWVRWSPDHRPGYDTSPAPSARRWRGWHGTAMLCLR